MNIIMALLSFCTDVICYFWSINECYQLVCFRMIDKCYNFWSMDFLFTHFFLFFNLTLCLKVIFPNSSSWKWAKLTALLALQLQLLADGDFGRALRHIKATDAMMDRGKKQSLYRVWNPVPQLGYQQIAHLLRFRRLIFSTGVAD